MRKPPRVMLLVVRAIHLIRRRGFMAFLRRLAFVGSWLPMLVDSGTPTKLVIADGEFTAALDFPRADGISRNTGLITGWALSRSSKIDRVEILIDGIKIGNASLCLPREDVGGGLPEADICGFGINLRPDQMPEHATEIRVGVVVRSISGRSCASVPLALPLGETVNPTSFAPLPCLATARQRRTALSARLKIACFAHDLGFGGGQLYLQELLRKFAADGQVDCVIRSPQNGPLRTELTALGFAVEIMQEPSTTNMRRHDRTVHALADWLQENEFDCVLANTLAGFYAVNAAALASLPSFWAIHESFPVPLWSAFYTRELPGSEFIPSRIETALRSCPDVVFESEATRQIFLRHGNPDRFHLIPYGVDVASIDRFLEGFDRRGARVALGIPEKSRVLLCMGTIEPRKQQIFLAQSFGQVLPSFPETNLLLVGDFPSDYSQALHRYIERRRLQTIRLTSTVPDPYLWYAIADGFVLLSAVESVPRSIMEAMAFGLPVLASHVFGVPELIVDGKSGFLVEPNSLTSAIDGLAKLLSLPDGARESVSRAAKEKIRSEHDSENYANACLSLIRGAISQRVGRQDSQIAVA